MFGHHNFRSNGRTCREDFVINSEVGRKILGPRVPVFKLALNENK